MLCDSFHGWAKTSFDILKWPCAVRIDEQEVLRPWYRNGRDLFQYHLLLLDFFVGEVHMVCFDLEMEWCAGFARVMDALRNSIPVSLLLALNGSKHDGEP